VRFATLLLLTALTLTAQDPGFDGPDDANPPVNQSDILIVQRAREILNSPAKWNRADNRLCPATEKTYSLYCALEKATDDVTKNFEHRGAAMQESRYAIDEVLAKGNHYVHRLMEYNNDPKTTFADVQKFFNLIEARIKKRLAAQSHNGNIGRGPMARSELQRTAWPPLNPRRPC
jgi:hypothetical protein